jgi:hypothetical protein
MEKKFKVGELVFLKNVGFPYNKATRGQDSWEGVSGIVTALNVGHNKQYVEVTPILPMRTEHGTMQSAVFYPDSCIRENRPWLRKHLKDILKLKRKIKQLALFASDID